jgi:hypothetical protein
VPTASNGLTDYQLGAGEATLDLRQLEPGAVDGLRAQVGFGSLVVLVPDDLRVRISTDVGLGEVIEDVDDRRRRTERFGDDREVLELGPSTGPELELDLQVGLGEIEVRRVQG